MPPPEPHGAGVPRAVVLAWLRATARRPLRAVTTVLVLAVLTVATGGSLVAGDAVARLFRDDALAEWGAVDLEARSVAGPFLPDGVARALTVQAGDAVVAGAPRLELRAVATSGERREPQALLLGLGVEEQGFPEPRALAGAARTPGLGPAEALVNDRLARRLGLRPGSALSLVVAVPQWDEERVGRSTPVRHPARALALQLRVAGVLADEGVADLHRTANVLVRREVLQEAAGLSPAASSALQLDVRADGRQGAEDVADALAPTAQRLGVALTPVKADALDLADEEGGLFRSILLSLAVLVLLAASAAAVELLTALALERAGELAVLRTLGVPQAGAARLLVAEGAAYAVVGSALGLLLAVPAGRALAGALSRHLASLEDGRGREQVPLAVDVGALPLVLGALVVLGTAVLAARASARRVLAGDLDEVLRGDPPPVDRAPSPGRPVVLLAAGAFLLGSGVSAPSGGGALVYLGLTLVLVAAWLRARRRSGARARTDARAAAGALAWASAGAVLLGDLEDGVQAGFGVLTVAGVVAVAAASSLLAGRLRDAGGLLSRLLPRGRPQVAVLLAASWGHRARDASVLRMCTVGGALFTVAALTVLGAAQGLPVQRQAGGFDALGTAVAGVDVARAQQALQARLPGTTAVAVPHAVVPQTAYRTQRDDDGPLREVVYPVRLAAVTPALVEQQRWGLAAGEHAGARAALEAVLRDEDKAVVDRYALPEGARVGDDVVLDTPGGERRFQLVGVLDTYLLGAVLVGGRSFDEVAARSGATLVLARGGGDPAQVARAWNAHERDRGLDLRPVAQVRADVVRANRAFTDVFAVLVLLGLLVVVVSLAAGVVRAARQRRAETAVARALGLHRRGTVLALVLDPLLPAALGALVGLATGLAVLRLLFAVGYSSLAWSLDVGRLAVAVGGTLLLLAVVGLVAALLSVRRGLEGDLADLG